jgi:hypothetical protein
MEEELIGLLTDRVGLDRDKATQVVETIVNFLKENPAKLTGLLGDNPMEMVTDTIGKRFGR